MYQQFVTTIRKNCINNKCDALKDRVKFMECELAMCSSDEIVYAALCLN